jgi:flagellar hook-length control protein FliK
MLEVNAANSKIVAETEEEMKAVEQYMSDIRTRFYGNGSNGFHL